MITLIIALFILGGIFNPCTGLFGNTYYSPKKDLEPTKPELHHRSFRLTREG